MSVILIRTSKVDSVFDVYVTLVMLIHRLLLFVVSSFSENRQRVGVTSSNIFIFISYPEIEQ